ncbi:MAG: hypothetical protein H0T47_11355 [Planctomycetaceae bacterium]|nr:hypothetical protein [Planctomycetaceae bacterium]
MTRRNIIPATVLAATIALLAGALYNRGHHLHLAHTPYALNRSTPTSCAEEDNINVPIFGPGVSQFVIEAGLPEYDISEDNCVSNWSNCPQEQLPDFAALRPDEVETVYDDGTYVLEVGRTMDWWNGLSMSVVVGDLAAQAHYLRLYKRVPGKSLWPQVLVLYQDGNMRLIPHPPSRKEKLCFGSSIVVGPVQGTERPIAPIREVRFHPGELRFQVRYVKPGTADLVATTTPYVTRVTVNVGYEADADTPLAAFRSMWVEDCNADVSHLETGDGEFPIMSWTRASGTYWRFFRKSYSVHNTSAPDIAVRLTRGS